MERLQEYRDRPLGHKSRGACHRKRAEHSEASDCWNATVFQAEPVIYLSYCGCAAICLIIIITNARSTVMNTARAMAPPLAGRSARGTTASLSGSNSGRS